MWGPPHEAGAKLEMKAASFAQEQFPADKNENVVSSHAQDFFRSEQPELNAQQDDPK
jgi:hypothetical protein